MDSFPSPVISLFSPRLSTCSRFLQQYGTTLRFLWVPCVPCPVGDWEGMNWSLNKQPASNLCISLANRHPCCSHSLSCLSHQSFTNISRNACKHTQTLSIPSSLHQSLTYKMSTHAPHGPTGNSPIMWKYGWSQSLSLTQARWFVTFHCYLLGSSNVPVVALMLTHSLQISTLHRMQHCRSSTVVWHYLWRKAKQLMNPCMT